MPLQRPRIYSGFKNHWFCGLNREICIRLTLPMNASLKHGFKRTSFRITTEDGKTLFISIRYLQISYAMKKGQVYRWIGAWKSFSGLWRQRLEFRNARGQGIDNTSKRIIDMTLKFSINFSLSICHLLSL